MPTWIARRAVPDRATLERLMDRLEIHRSVVKPAGAWVAEKLGRLSSTDGCTAIRRAERAALQRTKVERLYRGAAAEAFTEESAGDRG